jgi:hypothetical protein
MAASNIAPMKRYKLVEGERQDFIPRAGFGGVEI